MLLNHFYGFDLTASGWIQLLIGLALAVSGSCLMMGQGGALVAGIVVAELAPLVRPHVTAVGAVLGETVIAIDAVVIWALVSARRQATSA